MAGEAVNLGGQLNALAESFQRLGVGPGVQGLQDALIQKTSRIGEPDFDPLDPASVKKRISWLSQRGFTEEAQELAVQYRQMQAADQTSKLRGLQITGQENALAADERELVRTRGLESLRAMSRQWHMADEAGDQERKRQIEESMEAVAAQTGQTEDVVTGMILDAEARDLAEQQTKIRIQNAKLELQLNQRKVQQEAVVENYHKIRDQGEAKVSAWKDAMRQKGFGNVVDDIEYREDQIAITKASAKQMIEKQKDLSGSEYIDELVSQGHIAKDYPKIYQAQVREQGTMAANANLLDHIDAQLSSASTTNAIATLPNESDLDMWGDMIKEVDPDYSMIPFVGTSGEQVQEASMIAHTIYRNGRGSISPKQAAAQAIQEVKSGRADPSASVSAAPATPEESSQPSKIGSAEEFNALPAGSVFVNARDGKTYSKNEDGTADPVE